MRIATWEFTVFLLLKWREDFAILTLIDYPCYLFDYRIQMSLAFFRVLIDI
ncbi:hypothetical protein SBDP1_160024 [Syntrophobacter sp. SbD1]|nr:hypothetical protein SBDP1_160024 [Syntrophobacter sp. SbD1]